MYNVYQHWDPLKVCIVGKSYPPEFYSFIENPRVRRVMERIATETEEDYQALVAKLESLGVKTLRPTIADRSHYLIENDSRYVPPPMTPRDYAIMLGNDFFFKNRLFTEWDLLTWGDTLNTISDHAAMVFDDPDMENQFNSATATRVGKDIYIGTEYYTQDKSLVAKKAAARYPNYRWHVVDTGGHNDGTFCPVVPGLIVSLLDIPTYKDTFPDWEVVYLPGQSWSKIRPFMKLKEKNKGKWWVPGEELNDEFTEFVESWLNKWVGYVEETVFDVNMLVVDQKNVICSNYNKDVFDAFARHGITPHIVNFRHRYFWDGGLHCITVDVHRDGTMQNYFPDRP